jgi:deoxyribodipyrimidine photolyase-related protein
MSKCLTVILGNQLFPLKYYMAFKSDPIFMAEDYGLCTHFRYHKHKILLFLIAMRRYRDELQEKGFDVHYQGLNSQESYLKRLKAFIQNNQIQTLRLFEVEDRFFEEQLAKLPVEIEYLKSPMFMVSREEFQAYLASVKKPLMKSFYEGLRKKHGILMKQDKPLGGKFSFDADNRKKLPKNDRPPQAKHYDPQKIPYFEQVVAIIERYFSKHPGQCQDFRYATNRKEALACLQDFIKHRLEKYGSYQDAITASSDFVYHSLISPYLNMGLLTADEVIQKVAAAQAPLNSKEGFIRQVLGWREFVRGIYQEFDETQQRENFFKHQRKLTQHWYRGDTGIPPLDDAIQKVQRIAYNHHIERLMIISNLMLMCQIHPKEVYAWFMEMYVDSSDWVMGPNVFGMGQFSDGGIFATKPYFSGSNYLLKMSDYKKGEWCDAVDGLYWSFIERNKDFFLSNHRLSMMVRSLEKMNPERKETIFSAAQAFTEKVTRK